MRSAWPRGDVRWRRGAPPRRASGAAAPFRAPRRSRAGPGRSTPHASGHSRPAPRRTRPMAGPPPDHVDARHAPPPVDDPDLARLVGASAEALPPLDDAEAFGAAFARFAEA